jgi:hypothetical protein
MKKSKQARAREFTVKEKEEIYIRDHGQCIFCAMKYHLEDTTQYGRSSREYMHYIARSHGGLGIARNGALGCRDHHTMMDNGNKGRHDEMTGLMRSYLMQQYPKWSEDELIYNKWKAFG